MHKLAEWSISGLHDALWRLVQTELTGKERSLALDVGAGPGEFSNRLSAAGCHTVACDINGKNFAAQCAAFVECDLNADWTRDLRAHSPFDLVVAQEVLEHIENPTKFVRDIGSLLKPGGVLFLTSPNSQDKASRIDYLFHGELPWFQLGQLTTSGHQTPIFVQLVYLMAITAGFELEGFYGYGRRAAMNLNWKGRLFERYLDRKMNGHCLNNVVNIWVLRNSNIPEKGMSHLSPSVLAKAKEWMRRPCHLLDSPGKAATNQQHA
jgi:2-polyprenyl-3-methyl-5-hydroxy-6-metoxy-1,4-benzoquinol methylase